ncbi:type II toxin-antitoxin system VapC family toxin [Roseimarinus sediminis]|uniref:type II toxin-antitoxin system VapC family toxin n=1 Tax=Roseimarinus sediminis TaxID=1610899 RepID=UPI003D1F9BF4
MEKPLICLDTSVIIEFYRKTDKSKSFFFRLTEKYDRFAISSITEFEIFVGSKPDQDDYWDRLFSSMEKLSFDSQSNKIAIQIDRKLKKISKQIDIPDLMIAACAMANDATIATLNEKHFSRIEGLRLITPE